MAELNTAQKDEVKRDIMRKWSVLRQVAPISKSELSTLLTYVDQAQEAAEADVISRIPGAHPARAWLIANATIGRQLICEVETKRAEVL